MGVRRFRTTITVDIRPEVEAELIRQADAHGRPVEAYVATLLEEAAHIPPASPAPVASNMVELFAPLRGFNLNFERDKDTGRDVEFLKGIWLTPIFHPN